MDPENQSWEQQSRAVASTAQLPWVPWIWSEVRKLFKSKSGIGSQSPALPRVQGHRVSFLGNLERSHPSICEGSGPGPSGLSQQGMTPPVIS